MNSYTKYRCWMILVAVVFSAGCGGGFDASGALQEANATNPQRLANLYAQHQRENSGKGPSNQKDFKAFIEQVNPVLLERIGVEQASIDDLFTSQRDGEALKIRYGLRGNDRSDPEPIVFESTGVDGVRIVAYTRLKIEEIDDEAEYNKLLGKAK